MIHERRRTVKNKDLLAMEKAAIVAKMNKAIAENDTEAFTNAFTELCEKIEENVLAQAQNMVLEQDANILAQRGVRQLTSKEREYYEKIADAMKSADPKQALAGVDTVFPETIINAVFDDLTANHPLLSEISATTVSGLTRMMLNTDGEQKAAWGKLTAKIIEELNSGFKEIDMTQDKLSAFIPVSKAMLDLGPEWLDRYVRTILQEAFANGLEDAIINGSGKDMPIGMLKQVGEGVTVTGGVYPDKEKISITKLDMKTMGGVTAKIAKSPTGKARTVNNLIMVVNPTDYYTKVLPAIRMLTPNGTYADALPVPAKIIQSAQIEEGTAAYGMANKYFLGVGMAKDGRIEYSDEYHFLEDERVYLIKGYANGFALDNNAFQALDISGLKAIRFKVDMSAEE